MVIRYDAKKTGVSEMSKNFTAKFPKTIWLAELDMFTKPNQLSMAWFKRGQKPKCNNYVRTVKYVRADCMDKPEDVIRRPEANR